MAQSLQSGGTVNVDTPLNMPLNTQRFTKLAQLQEVQETRCQRLCILCYLTRRFYRLSKHYQYIIHTHNTEKFTINPTWPRFVRSDGVAATS